MNFVDDTLGSLGGSGSSFEGSLLDDKYKIIRKIGEGGMGAVFLAEDTELDNRPVAIKSLPLIVAGNERSLRQLKKEAQLALKLSHPNIVTLRSFETSGHGPYLVMDYIAGKTLEEVLTEKERLSEEEVLALFKPIAEALDYAHTQGVIHRDIKPSNIMIRKDDVPFIMDFGIAREMKESFTRLTGKDTSGTLPYMSPEQIRGALPSPAQDVYSLAVTMYECLTGNPPFCRGDIHYQILNEQVDGSKLPDGLRDSVLKGLSKEAADRQKTCFELVTVHSPAPVQTPTQTPMNILTGSPVPHQQKMQIVDLGSGVTLEMVFIPGGIFQMGPSDPDVGFKDSEYPVHTVELDGFWIGKYEVTQAQYRVVMGTNPSYFKGDNRPVEKVSWFDAMEFCRKLSRGTGKTFTLPTEAQWEYACRAGTTGPYAFGDSLSRSDANYNTNRTIFGRCQGPTWDVGSGRANAWGLYDMHGNVSEWCLDWSGNDYYRRSPRRNPVGPDSGEYRVQRGGSWLTFDYVCRSAFREGSSPRSRHNNVGFRLASPRL